MSYQFQFNEKLSRKGIELAWELFGLELDIPVCDAQYEGLKERDTQGSFVLKRERNKEGRIIKKKPLHIIIASNIGMSDEKKEDILKHELCHWACFVRGKSYKDGSKFFEQELLRIGANSSGFDNIQESRDYQQKIISGLDGRLGNKYFSYELLETDKNGVKYFTVKYAGCKIGVIKKKPRGVYPWVNVTEASSLFTYGYKARKYCVQELKEEWDKGKRTALDNVWKERQQLAKERVE